LPLLWWGLAPGSLARNTGLSPVGVTGVSPFGLALLFVLPWLAGGWLAVATARAPERLERLRRPALGQWAQRLASWAGGVLRGLTAAVYWLGQLGEGEGWWGWALTLLALGTLFLAAR
jgi:hypothetical protein